MKKLKCALFLLLCVAAVRLYGDIIILDPLETKVCIKIGNLHDYPDLVLVAVCNWESQRPRIHLIHPDWCIKTRSGCAFTVFAMKKSYYEKKNLNKTDWANDKNVIKSNIVLSTKDFSDGIAGVETFEVHYNIAGFDKDSMILYKAKEIFIFEDDKPNSVQDFEYEGDASKLKKKF